MVARRGASELSRIFNASYRFYIFLSLRFLIGRERRGSRATDGKKMSQNVEQSQQGLRKGRLGRLLAMSTISAVLATIGIGTPASATIGSRCGFATLIGVRGTYEDAGTGSSNGGRTYASGGLGNVVRNFGIGMQSDPNIPVYVEALNYPAVFLQPGNPQAASYASSLSIGTNNLRGEIENLTVNCPQTNILLAGYSQGAHVINNVLRNDGGLSAAAKAHVRAVVMFGSPTFHGGEAWNAPGAGSSHGVVGMVGNADLAQYKHLTWVPPSYVLGYLPAVRSFCLSGDFFCQTNFTDNGMSIHESYATSSVMLQAQLFVKSWLTDDN